MADATQEHLKKLTEILEAVRNDWPSICTNPRMSFDKERDWAIAACMKSGYAADLGVNRWQDLQQALRNVGAIGVTLDPAQKLAFILPRDGKMIYDLSYLGLIDVAVQAGTIKWAQARRVWSGETYEPQGYDRPPIHKRKPFAKKEERGDLLGVYVVAKTTDGDYLTDEMTIEEVNEIRAGSQSYKEHVASNGQKKTPWVGPGEGEMQKKTVVKRAQKYWPHSERLAAAIHYLNTDGGQGMDLTTEDESATRVKIWTEKVNACTTGDEVAKVWKEAREVFKEAEDLKGYEDVKKAVAAKNKALGVAPPPPPAATTAPTPAPTPAATNAPTAAPTAAPTTAPTPAPSAAPRQRAAAPTPTPAPSPEATIMRAIDAVSDADAAQAFEALNAIAERIDVMPADLQDELNDAWNAKLAAVKAKHGIAN